MKLGFWLAAGATAFGPGSKKVRRQAELPTEMPPSMTSGGTRRPTAAPTMKPSMWSTTKGYMPTDYTNSRPDRPNSPYPDHHDASHSGSHSEHNSGKGSGKGSGRPHSERPHDRPNMGGEMGGCNGRAMASWKKAMAHWYEQQKEWEYHFNMWKDGNGGMDYHHDDDYSGDGDWGSGGDWEWGSGMDMGTGMWGGSMWEQLMPIFDFMNSPDFCDMFMMMPAEWDPKHWTGLCHANQKLQKEIEEVVMYMMSGMMGKEDFSKKTCDAVGGYLIEAFELSYWPEGIPLVYAMESSCHCTHDFVYDLVMGNEMDWMAMYQCGQTWMGAMEWFNQPMIPQNWTVPAGSEQLLGLWMESKEDLDYFMMDPYNALMKYAKEWMINPQEIVDGLNMADQLMEIQQAKLAAYGIEGDIKTMNSTDLYMALEQSMDRVHMWWDADADKKHEMEYDYDTMMAMDEEFKSMIEFIEPFGFDTREMTRLFMDMYGMNESGELNAITYYNMYAETMADLVMNDTTVKFIPWDAFKWIVEHGEMFYMAWIGHLEMDQDLNEENHSLVDHIFATWEDEIMKYMYGMEDAMKPMDEMME